MNTLKNADPLPETWFKVTWLDKLNHTLYNVFIFESDARKFAERRQKGGLANVQLFKCTGGVKTGTSENICL